MPGNTAVFRHSLSLWKGLPLSQAEVRNLKNTVWKTPFGTLRFGGDFFLNYTEKLEKKPKNPLEKFEKKSSGDGAPKLQMNPSLVVVQRVLRMARCWIGQGDTGTSRKFGRLRREFSRRRPDLLVACAMTTNFLDNKNCTFKFLLSWPFPRKNSVSTPTPNPPQKCKFDFYCRLAVSDLLGSCLSLGTSSEESSQSKVLRGLPLKPPTIGQEVPSEPVAPECTKIAHRRSLAIFTPDDPDPPTLAFFFWKKATETPKKQGFFLEQKKSKGFYLRGTPQSLEKKGKNAQKSKGNRKTKKARKSKKARIGIAGNSAVRVGWSQR